MSTKATIAYGPNFHLYREALDEDFVYLELEGVRFEASYQRVMVPIPVHIWEIIRRYPGIDLSFAEKTDEELRQHVARDVDDRIARYSEADEKAKGLIALFGSLAFGSADTPREEQIECGMAYYKEVRDHQRQVKAAISQLEQSNTEPPAAGPTGA